MESFVFGQTFAEDLDLGYGTVANVKLPDGSQNTLSKIGIHKFLGSAYLSAADQPGSDAGEKIANSIAALAAFSSIGGTVDARSLAGNQSISSDFFDGVTIPGELLLGATTFASTFYVKVPSNWVVRGSGAETLFYAAAELPHIPEIGSASAVLYVKANAVNVTIRDLSVRGPYTGTGTSGTTFGIYAGDATTDIQFLNNRVMNASWSGIHLFTGSKMLVQGNYTEHNAIDGIESWASDSQIVSNRSYDDGAASANGVGSIEILPGASNVIVAGNISDRSNHHGIAVSSGGAAQNGITICSNQVYSPGTRGIVDNAGSTNIKIIDNLVDSPRGSGTLGNGIMLSNSTNFTVAMNTVVNANVGTGPNGYELAGTCNHGVFIGNTANNCWVGVAITGTSGSVGTILVTSNHSYGSTSGLNYANTSAAAYIKAYMNSWGTTAFTASIPGTTTNDDAAAGDVGEYVHSTIAIGGAVALTTDTTANITSITLTPGDWDVQGNANWNFNQVTTYTILQAGISTISATLGGRDSLTVIETPAAQPTALTDPSFPTPLFRLSLASTVTVYFVARATFTVNSLAVYGTIRARRVR